jgi:N-methylhydantoinase A
MATEASPRARVGIDTGGTFTDLVAFGADRTFRLTKVLSTPDRPASATVDALEKAGLLGQGSIDTLVHGTTIATNAIIERRGATVGLIATAGFGDILLIQRVIRPRSFDLDWVKPRHLVPRYLVREARERVNANGAVTVPLVEDDVRSAVRELIAEGVEALAISFLFAFLDPGHERRARDVALEEAPDLAVSISSEVFGQWREYERTSTTVIDAFLKPGIGRYADELEEIASAQRVRELLILRSNGGVMTTGGARERPVSVVRSGPAGGVVASVFIGELTGRPNLILADMGGTSFDTCLVRDGEPALTTQAEIEWGIPIANPMVDVRSIGAGGGSVAWLDTAGILRVGPRSAGSVPGPACYGRGGEEATVTDANLVLGRLSPELPLAGDVDLHIEAADRTIGSLARSMGRSVEDVALGIVRIADNNMAQALRLVSVDRGHDPREFALIAFGGAGPLHATALARVLSIGEVIVPVFPGAFSAFGALLADARFDSMRTLILSGGSADVQRIAALYDDLERDALATLARERIGEEPELTRTVEMRYAGQNWELTVPLPGSVGTESLAAARRAFHEEHRAQFGWNMPDGDLELVNFALTVTVRRERALPPSLPTGPLPAPRSRRRVTFDDGMAIFDTPVYWRDDLLAGNRLEGPAIVAEMDSTVLLDRPDRLLVDSYGNFVITVS